MLSTTSKPTNKNEICSNFCWLGIKIKLSNAYWMSNGREGDKNASKMAKDVVK